MIKISISRSGRASWAISLALIVSGSALAAPQTIWKKGGSVRGNCSASVAGKILMDGPCSGLGHGNSVFVTAERDGCSIELMKSAKGVVGKIFAYKNDCGDLDGDVNLGVFTADGTCWKTASAKLCLEAGR